MTFKINPLPIAIFKEVYQGGRRGAKANTETNRIQQHTSEIHLSENIKPVNANLSEVAKVGEATTPV